MSTHHRAVVEELLLCWEEPAVEAGPQRVEVHVDGELVGDVRAHGRRRIEARLRMTTARAETAPWFKSRARWVRASIRCAGGF